MEVLKLNFDKNEYEIIEKPTNYDIKDSLDIDKIINCINCGKRISKRMANSSLIYCNILKQSYCVCSDCYNEELAERYKEHIPRID